MLCNPPRLSHAMDVQHSPQPSILSGSGLKRDSDGDNYQYGSGDESLAGDGDVNENGDGPRKAQCRPVRVSCELCKQRKVKCDRGQPSCRWCSRNGARCEYKERKKPGLRAGYGRELEQRLDRLEDILQTHARILETALAPQQGNQGNHVNQSNQAALHDGQMLGNHLPRVEGQPFMQQKTSAFSGSTPQHADFPNSLSPPTPSMQSMQGDAYMQQQHQAQQHQAQQQQQQIIQNGSQSAAQFYNTAQPPVQSPTLNISESMTEVPSDSDLPPYDLLYALVDLFFKHVNTWCSMLHRRSTLDSLFGPSQLEEADRILLHAIVATTLRFSNDPRLTDERRSHYHDISKQKVLLYGLENSSVKALQAMVILALDLVGDSNGPPGWNVLGLITRAVVQLGLAVETTSFSVAPDYQSIYTLRAMVLPDAKDWIEDESRRRLVWMIYLLDRYATIATAFEFALDEKEIDRKLPCRDDLWNKNVPVETRWFHTHTHAEFSQPPPPENLGAFSYYIEILGILSRIHQFLKKPVDISALPDVEKWQGEYRELDNLLTSWKFDLPPDYGSMARLFQPGSSRTITCGWVMLHATYHTTVIRLHSSAAYPTTRSPIFTPSYSASQRCHGAVENIAALGEFVVANNMLPKLGPPFAFTLWVAARLLLVHGSTIEHKLSPQIQFFVDTLHAMSRYWKVAGRYSTILQRVLDEHSDSETSAAANGEERVTPSSVKILADMRRCAYDLDFLISRQPRHIGALGRLGGQGQPNRTPAQNELEYLDVFDFFNVPRLRPAVVGGEGLGGTGGRGGEAGMQVEGELGAAGANGNGNGNGGEFNITNFMVDANSDWLFKN
ncbi:hypothetical protein VC83_04325 [Pseudogymnoascus destructans]|uniref:Zn(2)-C6 fungal-type domain-containing protein n=1 Tax=Pseudogymnoascus destructans TaxID=655981 RepID=A0A177AAK2_9PEZI|nr:uncharacterized protein VC83_04325 [Pseudogymnoascus destructans]OAF59145.1 hypothetical protein VC83_04325 [Pseudogymnoascus destructans]